MAAPAMSHFSAASEVQASLLFAASNEVGKSNEVAVAILRQLPSLLFVLICAGVPAAILLGA